MSVELSFPRLLTVEGVVYFVIENPESLSHGERVIVRLDGEDTTIIDSFKVIMQISRETLERRLRAIFT